MSARMIDHPEVAASVALIHDRLVPVTKVLGDAIDARFPEASEPGASEEAAGWFNGALYGMLATFIFLNDTQEGLRRGEIEKLYQGFAEFFTAVVDEHGGDADAAARALVPLEPADMDKED